MNQILFTGDKNDRLQTKKIIIIFSIVISIFAICLIGKGIYGITQVNKNQISQTKVKPNINIATKGGSAIIEVKHEIAIDSITYSWNNGEEMQIKDVNGRNEIETTIQVPNEDAVLKIKIIDNDKNEYNAVEEFEYDENIDLEKPQLEMPSTITMAQSITVVATDNEEISYLTYKWDDDEETKVENSGEDKKTMEVDINLQEGKTKLVVTAVDHNDNKTTQQKDIVVVTPPEITLKRNKGELIIRVKDEEEVTKVVYEINGTKYTKENTGDNKKEFEIKELLSKGENIVKVTAYNKKGITSEKVGKCTY